MSQYKTTRLIKNTLVLATFSCAAANALSGPTNVPFKGTFSTIETLAPANADGETQCGTTPMVGMLVGSGKSTNLGRINLSGIDCVTPSPGPYGLPNFNFSDGIITITAANGDNFKVYYSGSFQPTGGQDSSKKFIYKLQNGQFSVIPKSGTGRFVNVTGKGDLTGTEYIDVVGETGATGEITLSGTISY